MAEMACDGAAAGRLKVLAVIGPTAVGKTALSLELADRLNAEIISVDSRQVYRYMDIGTDKISPAQRRLILHHLIDEADPDQVYTASDFARDALDAARRIAARGRVPLFVGGTPFYYQALMGGLISVNVPPDEGVRSQLNGMTDVELHGRLGEVDPLTAKRLHPNDRFRILRALEIYSVTGTPPSELFAQAKKTGGPLDVLYLGLNRDREELREIIAQRVKEQFDAGYADEVEWLLSHGFSADLPSMKGFGYRELAAYHQGRMTYQEALDGDVTATRQFAKRQMTWFRKFEPAVWFDRGRLSAQTTVERMLEAARRHLEG